MKKIWHPYYLWEEFHYGMWKNMPKEEEEKFLELAVVFTGNAELYGSFMFKVIFMWPISCEHNLSDTSINRRAWIGHAACCLAIGCPEYITRKAWWKLTEKQRQEANNQADRAIIIWERGIQYAT